MPTPSETRNILDSLEIRPKKKLGQNFLIDGNIARKSLQLASLSKDDCVVEVGPGLGMLTQALLEAGASVYAVEKDPNLFSYLAQSLQIQYPSKLNIINADAIQHPVADLPDEKSSKPFKIIANLPYAISSPWLDVVLNGPLPISMTLMVQTEAANRYLAKSGNKHFGPISIFLQSCYRIQTSYAVSRSCFYPIPNIDSVLLHLERLDTPINFYTSTRKLIRAIFTQRRKQIGSIIRKLPEHDRLSKWLKACEDLTVTPTHRPEDVPLEAWQRLRH